MKKLEPGMLCRVVGSTVPENEGKVVTLVVFVGVPPIRPLGSGWAGNDWWEIEESLTTMTSITRDGQVINYARGSMLQPINPDHQPADEEWQADFKRLLCGDRHKSEVRL